MSRPKQQSQTDQHISPDAEPAQLHDADDVVDDLDEWQFEVGEDSWDNTVLKFYDDDGQRVTVSSHPTSSELPRWQVFSGTRTDGISYVDGADGELEWPDALRKAREEIDRFRTPPRRTIQSESASNDMSTGRVRRVGSDYNPQAHQSAAHLSGRSPSQSNGATTNLLAGFDDATIILPNRSVAAWMIGVGISLVAVGIATGALLAVWAGIEYALATAD
jgi:hypothetical protein